MFPLTEAMEVLPIQRGQIPTQRLPLHCEYQNLIIKGRNGRTVGSKESEADEVVRGRSVSEMVEPL